MHLVTSTRRPSLARSRLAALAFALTIAVGLSLALFPGSSAVAAFGVTPGRMIDFAGWTVGTFQRSDGRFLYCVEPGAVTPAAEEPSSAVVDELRGYSILTSDATGWSGTVSTNPLSGEPLRRINYVLSNHGDTQNADQAVAVQFAIWLLRDAPGEAAWLNHHIDWVERAGGAWHIDEARRLAAEAIEHARPSTPPTPVELRLQQSGPSTGVLAYPAGTTELSIEGATFDDGSRVITVTDGRAGTVGWQAELHHEGWQRLHPISVTGRWTLPASGWPAQLEIFPSPVPSEQTLTWSVGPVSEPHTGELTPAALTLDAQFTPWLSTQVTQRWLPRGAAPFADAVRLDVVAGSAPWAHRQTGEGKREYLPVIADGVVYGPFNRPQPTTGAAPQGAPVAGAAQILADRGPGEYRVTTPEMPDEAGYYYWVWHIREADQPAAVRETQLLPADYAFSDDFGLEAEGHVVPTALRWSTELDERELTLDRLELRDRVVVTLHHGAWLRDSSGARIPVRLRQSVFHSSTEPVRQAEVPSGAKEIARGLLEVSTPNREVTAETITLPEGTRGWVTVRTCLVAEDQPEQWRGYIEEWCDDYGVPAETARILEPEALATTGGDGTGMLIAGGGGVLLLGAALALAGVTRRRRR